MAIKKSHGRLRGIGVYLAVPTVLGVTAGLWLGGEIFRGAAKDETQTQQHQETLLQSTSGLANSVHDRIQVLKKTAFEISTGDAPSLARTPFELVVEYDTSAATTGGDLQLGHLLNTWTRAEKSDAKIDAKIIDQLIFSAAEQIQISELTHSGAVYLRNRGIAALQTQWIGFAFIDTQTGGKNHSVIAAWSKPENAFPMIQMIEEGEVSTPNAASRFILNADGQVIAHSHRSMAGLDLSKSAFFQRQGRRAFRTEGRTQEVIPSETAAGDGTVKIAFEKLAGLPFMVVMESSVIPAQAGLLGQIKKQNWKLIGTTFMGVLIFGAFAAWSLERKIRRSTGKKSATLPPALPRVILPPPAPVQAVAENFVVSQNQKQAVREEQIETAKKIIEAVIESEPARIAPTPAPQYKTIDAGLSLVEAFETRFAAIKDAGKVAQGAAETAALLCESPTLFFTYHSGVRAGLLQTTVGFPKGQSPKGMSFPISPEAERAILKTAAAGKVPTLGKLDTLAKVVLNRLGVGHFEAWAITKSSEAAPSGQQILGILVVLQAGVQSSLHQPSLARMIKSVGQQLDHAPTV